MVYKTMYRFRPGTFYWDIIFMSAHAPAARTHHAAIVVGDKMLVFGGDHQRANLTYEVQPGLAPQLYPDTAQMQGEVWVFRFSTDKEDCFAKMAQEIYQCSDRKEAVSKTLTNLSIHSHDEFRTYLQ